MFTRGRRPGRDIAGVGSQEGAGGCRLRPELSRTFIASWMPRVVLRADRKTPPAPVREPAPNDTKPKKRA